MKRFLLLTLTSLLVMSATGCVEKIDFDAEQEDKFVQYAVYAVLEHDKNYLVKLETTVEKETESESEEQTTVSTPDDEEQNSSTNTDSDNDNSTTVTTTDIADALNLRGVSFTYCGHKVCDSYPDGDSSPAFVIKALDGKKLVVLNFDIRNTTNSSVNMDISSMDVYFKGIFNKSVKTNAQVTLLPEGLNTYEGDIAAGETVRAVLVFELSESSAEDISSITLEVKSGNEIKSVKIQ